MKATPNSDICSEQVPAYILGDSAYPNRVRSVPTYQLSSQGDPITRHLNEQLAAVRYCIENAFGILKGRFRILNRDMECASEDMGRAIRLILTIFTLHNFLVDRVDAVVIEPILRDAEEQELGVMNAQDRDVGTRDILWRHRCYYETEE